MNELFVNVKVDREERPDVDAVYMEATTALTGHGGWPMTVFLAPGGEPFYAGTFFPRQQFVQLLHAVAQTWQEKRSDVLEAGQRIVAALDSRQDLGTDVPTAQTLDSALSHLVAGFDERHGGFGGAPKFPPSMVLEFLLRHHERTGDRSALAIAGQTLEAMARGGIYDQLGGGFARYSVDESWVVPHFEKMLYDNAQLLRVYLHWYRLTGSEIAERVARETADFLLRDLLTGEGGFASALDADTDGVEGLTYVWTPEQLAEVLHSDAEAAAGLYGVTAEGTFENGASTLQLPGELPPADVRDRLFKARLDRPQPARDDKVVTAWNGLAIAALAEAARHLDDDRYLDAATGCAHLLVGTHLVDGRLRRVSRDGVAGDAAGVAEDYGDLAEGLLVLHQVTGEVRWYAAARDLLRVALDHFRDEDGGFFDVADDAEALVRRPKDPTDNAAPSGNSALAHALLSYAALSGDFDCRQAAEQALATVSALMAQQPRFAGWALAAGEALAGGPIEVAVVGESGSGPLTEAAWRHRPPGAVVLSGEPDQMGLPLLADRPLVSGGPAAYVCRGMVCQAPVTEVSALVEQLTG
jgi:uncharacterized protein YyaL (SSP411 family)